jgi:hypothetical protein
MMSMKYLTIYTVLTITSVAAGAILAAVVLKAVGWL